MEIPFFAYSLPVSLRRRQKSRRSQSVRTNLRQRQKEQSKRRIPGIPAQTAYFLRQRKPCASSIRQKGVRLQHRQEHEDPLHSPINEVRTGP